MTEVLLVLAKDSGLASSTSRAKKDWKENLNEVGCTANSCEQIGRKLQNFVIAKGTNRLLLQAVCEHDAHFTLHNTKTAAFTKVCETFLRKTYRIRVTKLSKSNRKDCSKHTTVYACEKERGQQTRHK